MFQKFFNQLRAKDIICRRSTGVEIIPQCTPPAENDIICRRSTGVEIDFDENGRSVSIKSVITRTKTVLSTRSFAAPEIGFKDTAKPLISI